MKKKRFKKICHQIAAVAMAILMIPNTEKQLLEVVGKTTKTKNTLLLMTAKQ